MQTEDLCGGNACLKFASAGLGAFAEVGEVEVVGFVSCGGCPGKKAVPRAEMLVKKGAEVIVLASCISLGTPIGFPCPFAEQIKDAIAHRLGTNITILDYSHPAGKKH